MASAGKDFWDAKRRNEKAVNRKKESLGVADVEQAAIVTGASSGIGKEISRVLCDMGYEVFGIGRHFTKTESIPDSEAGFHPLVCDLLDTKELTRLVNDLRKEHKISVLVNNAGVGYYGLHEEISIPNLQAMLRTNLEVPLILSRLLLRDLKKTKGYIINISSVTAWQSNPHGCAYGASKAGLSSFSKSLFDEARKYGLKVLTIHPDMTKTDLYRNADFCEGGEEASYLLPQEVAAAVRYALSQRDTLVMTDISLKPQLHRIQKKKHP